MKKTRSFKFLAFMTYAPIYLLGTMIIFGLMGKLGNIGWLESAPHVLMIPTLIIYYISLIMGAIYGYLRKEEPVYLMALFGIGAWIIGILIGSLTSLSKEVMVVINVIFLAGFLVLHLLQLRATKNWGDRLISVK